MVGWHHRCDGREFDQALRVGDGQGSLECCSPWGRKELDTTEQLSRRSNTLKEIMYSIHAQSFSTLYTIK